MISANASLDAAHTEKACGHPAWRLFAVSFTALFFELMVIRWAPSIIRLVAYYANLMLISSFLGLGIGAMLARRRIRLFHWFPLLMLVYLFVLLACRNADLPGSSTEGRFNAAYAHLTSYLIITAVFVFNAAVFVPLGQQIGKLFQTMPPLRAYAWDLGGSLCGTVIFGLFSFLFFSPFAGLAIVIVIFLILTERQHRWWQSLLFAGVMIVMLRTNETGFWSPYYHITIRRYDIPADAGQRENAATNIYSRALPLVTKPENNIRTINNPPVYIVNVNQDFYQPHMTINPLRYTNPLSKDFVRSTSYKYDFPYLVSAHRKKVAVLGAGGGTDVEAALLNGAEHVDAVEIDPMLVKLSHQFNPSGVYDDPRVTVHTDDARAFLRRALEKYDIIVFGWLDSQALFSHMSNIRLDGYIYTAESIRSAFNLLNEQGWLAISFVAGADWLSHKLFAMVKEGTGQTPYVYAHEGSILLAVARGQHSPPPPAIGDFIRIEPSPAKLQAAKSVVPTDDWPYLYLSRRTIPSDYLFVITLLLLVSVTSVLTLRSERFGSYGWHFLFLGVGFLLLETSAITNCCLYFGSTWLVTMIVVAGVLLMVLAANYIAGALKKVNAWLYLLLLASLLPVYLVPQDAVLMMSFWQRVSWVLLIVPLPVFFAGLIFSVTFRDSSAPAFSLGANLVGAMIGGFSEYLGMAIGHRNLILLIAGAYLSSLLCLIFAKRQRFRTAAPC